MLGLYIGLGVGALVLIAIFVVKYAFKKNKMKAKTNVVETKTTRYTYETDTLDAEGHTKISLTKGDWVLASGNTYKVGVGEGMIKPGKYTILTSDEKTDKFNVRVDGYVREYKHNQEIILADNSEITAVSHTIILR